MADRLPFEKRPPGLQPLRGPGCPSSPFRERSFSGHDGPGLGCVGKQKGVVWYLVRPQAEDSELEVVAFLCGADGKLSRQTRGASGNLTSVSPDVVFYNKPKRVSGKIWLTGDHRTGAVDGDDEPITGWLNECPPRFHKCVFVVQIDEGRAQNRSLGVVRNAFIRVVDRKNTELVRFDLAAGLTFAKDRSMIFGELLREGAGLTFNVIGTSHEADSFISLIEAYL